MADSERLYKATVDIETSYGTGAGAPTPIPLTNDSFPELEYDEIAFPDYSSSLGRSTSYVGAKKWNLPVKFYLKGTGSTEFTAGTACELGKLLRAFGLEQTLSAATSQTWKVRDSSFESVTMVINLNGTAYTVTGGRGEELRIPLRPGRPVLCEGRIKGRYNAPSSVAYSAPTFQDVLIVPPSVSSLALTINSQTHIIPECDVIIKNAADFLENVNASNDGIESYDITGREYGMEFLAVRDSNNDLEFWTHLVTPTIVAVASTGYGTSGGNKWDFDFTNFQITSVKPEYYKGVQAYRVVGAVNKHATAASEFQLKLT